MKRKTDRRTLMTKQMIKDALLELLAHTPYEKATRPLIRARASTQAVSAVSAALATWAISSATFSAASGASAARGAIPTRHAAATTSAPP